MTLVYLGLGSNLGDRCENIYKAVEEIKKIEETQLLKFSSIYQTKPLGNAKQPDFLNAATEIETQLKAYKLLEKILAIENCLGRERKIQWGPRTIDIDILFFGDQIISDDNLVIPHPLLSERPFVIIPLKEIAPLLQHPVLDISINDIYQGLPENTDVKLFVNEKNV